MKPFVSLAFAAALALAGPALAQPAPSVQDLANRWTAAYNQGDAASVAGLYSPNAELYIHREGRYAGRAAIREYWADDMRRAEPITVLTVTDSVTDNEMMLVHGNYQVLNRRTGVPQGGGRFAHIWVRGAAGQWTLDRDVWVDRTQ
jgi:ketosteroid isomerase-like protein